MRSFKRLLIALLCVTVPAYGADPVCYEYRFDVSNTAVDPYRTWKSTESQAADAWAAACTSSEEAWESPACANYSPGSGIGTFDVSIDEGGGCSYKRLTGSWSRGAASNTKTTCLSRQVVECPEDPCVNAKTISDGWKEAGNEVTTGASSEPSGMMCSSDDGHGGGFSGGLYGAGCEVIRDGAGIGSDGGHWYGQVKYTGQSCPADPAPDPLDSKANCISTASGRVCVSKKKHNCGSVDGVQVCLSEVPEGDCMLLSNGGAVCDASATNVPKDDMGEPLEASGTISQTSGGTGTSSPGTTKTYNYYSSSVVQSSSTTVTGSDGGGDGDGDGDGDGAAEACESDEDCFGSVAEDSCADDLVACVTGAAVGLYEEFGATPLIAAATGLYSSFPDGGACPSAPVEVFEESTDAMGSFCTLMEGNADLLGLFFAIGWSLAGLRILLGGNE